MRFQRLSMLHVEDCSASESNVAHDYNQRHGLAGVQKGPRQGKVLAHLGPPGDFRQQPPHPAAGPRFFPVTRTMYSGATSQHAGPAPPILLPPPRPGSFNLAAAVSAPAKGLEERAPQTSYRSAPAYSTSPGSPYPPNDQHAQSAARYVIDLDTSECEDDDAAKQALALGTAGPSLGPPAAEESASRVATRALSPPRNETVVMLSSLLRSVDESFRTNEATIRRAVEGQTALKLKLAQYKKLISQGKSIKKQLTSKKAVLLTQLLRASQALELSERSSPLHIADAMPLTEELPIPLSPSTAVVRDMNEKVEALATEPLVAEPPKKRKAEMAELERQLDKVKIDLEKSKHDLLKQQSLKKQKTGKRPKKNHAMAASFVKILRESKEKAREMGPLAKVQTLGKDLVAVCGNLYPLEAIVEIWRSLLDLQLAVTSFDAQTPSSTAPAAALHDYESPLTWFKSSIFFRDYTDFVPKKGLLSSTFANKIDPMKPFCRDEFEFGCSDKSCKFQHLKQVQYTDDELLENVIQRLLKYKHTEQFGDTLSVLAFIHAKLSAGKMKGVPLVTLVSELLAMRKEIADAQPAVIGLDDAAPVGTLGKKTASAVLKSFCSAIAALPGRHYCELASMVASGDLQKAARYYQTRLGVENDSLIGLLESLDLKGLGAFEAEIAKTKDEFLRWILLDIKGAVAKCHVSAPAAKSLRPLAWLALISSWSLEEQCACATVLLSSVSTSWEATCLILALAKSAVDKQRHDEVTALFLAVLKGEMFLDDNVIPCAQLCALPVRLEPAEQIRLWLFYLDYLNTGSYQRGQFLEYPYESVCSRSKHILVNWTKEDVFEDAKQVLEHLNAEFAGMEALVYNLVALGLAQSVPAADTLKPLAVPPSAACTLHRLFSLPNEKLSVAEDDLVSLFLNVSRLIKLNMNALAASMLEAAKAQFSTRTAVVLAQIFSDALAGRPFEQRLEASFKEADCDPVLFAIGYPPHKDAFMNCRRSMLKELPVSLHTSDPPVSLCASKPQLPFAEDFGLLAEGVDSRLKDCIELVQPRALWEFDPKPPSQETLEALTERLLRDPANRSQWERYAVCMCKELIGARLLQLVDEQGLGRYRDALLLNRSRFF